MMPEVELRSADSREAETVTVVHGTAWTAIRHWFNALFGRKPKDTERRHGEYEVKRYR